MMLGLVLGNRSTFKKAVSTSAVTIATSAQKLLMALESVTICNTNAAARTVSLYVDNGSSQFYIFNDLPLASKATVLLTNHAVTLAAGETLKAIASGAGISVAAVILQSNPNLATDSGVNTLSSVAKK